jgi:signal peptidase
MQTVGELLRFQLKLISRLFAGACIALLLFLGVGPHVLGYRTLTVLTGSMDPAYPAGSVVVVSQQPAAALHKGQVLVYEAPIDDHRVVTHRVTEVFGDGGSYVVQTKGDANGAPDPWRARIASPTVWTVRFGVPVLGSLIRLLRTPILHKVLVYGVPLLIALMWVGQIWRAPGGSGARRPPREAHA